MYNNNRPNYCIDGQSFQIDSKRRRAESFEACCQWALLDVQIITLLFTFTEKKYTYPSVSKVYAGSFRVSVIHRTRTWTTGSLMCVHDHIILTHAYTHGGLGTTTASQHIFYSGKHTNVACAPDGI